MHWKKSFMNDICIQTSVSLNSGLYHAPNATTVPEDIHLNYHGRNGESQSITAKRALLYTFKYTDYLLLILIFFIYIFFIEVCCDFFSVTHGHWV